MDYKDLPAQEVFHWFKEINQIPRGSGDEKRISDFLYNWAKERNLDVWQDEALNIVIHKAATKGYENAPKVILQGHMDMVCEKGLDSNHDFSKDPIEMIVDGDYLRANDTTLGADDGIAVAMALAVLDADDIEHPAIEAVFTTAEETSMVGAVNLTNEHLSGDYLFNIDSEEEGIFLSSSSGGVNSESKFEVEFEDNSEAALEISLKGFTGGHSGMEIIKQRANAIKVLARLLNECNCDKLRLASIEGGTKHNAIANVAKATIVHTDYAKVKDAMNELFTHIKKDYHVEDPNMSLEFKEVKAEKVMTKKDTNRIINFLMLAPHGVIYMSKDIEGLVMTSCNAAVLRTEGNGVNYLCSIRSSSDAALVEVREQVRIMTEVLGGKVELSEAYPSWEFDEDPVLRDLVSKVYKEVTGKDAEVSAIHAGLECGLLKQILPDTKMISFGPNIYDVHTNREHLDIKSTARMWEFLKALLKAVH